MVNKQGLWFLTLTSLALVLSVYYITMPNDLLLSDQLSGNEEKSDKVNLEVEESDLITSMRVELDEERNVLQKGLEGKLSDGKLTVDEKNEVYEDLRYISEISSKESMIEKKLLDEFKLKSFVKISDDTVSIVIQSGNHDKNLAVNIMKSVGEEFENKMYISISFKE